MLDGKLNGNSTEAISTLSTPIANFTADPNSLDNLNLQLPDPDDEGIAEHDFQASVETAWQVCDRFDLQTDIWRGRILRTVRDREKRSSDNLGTSFTSWLKDRDISKSQAYSLIELADSADTLLDGGFLEPQDVNCFSKRAFIETSQASPEVQQMVSEAAHRGDHITRREVRQLSDEWTAMTSELLPAEVKAQAANHTIPSRYLAPLVREMEKLPVAHQISLRSEVAASPDIDTLKQATAEARSLAKYLQAASQVQAIQRDDLNLESALEEALRLGCLNATADLVNQASQLEQAIAKVYTSWKRVNNLAERVYVDSGASTPQLRRLLSCLEHLSGEVLEIQLGTSSAPQLIRLQIQLIEPDPQDP